MSPCNDLIQQAIATISRRVFCSLADAMIQVICTKQRGSWPRPKNRKRPKNIDVNQALAWLYFNQHDLKNAQQHMLIALRTGNTDPELLQRAGAIEFALGNAGQRDKFMASARKTNPTFTL